jgi:hypothetical protein
MSGVRLLWLLLFPAVLPSRPRLACAARVRAVNPAAPRRHAQRRCACYLPAALPISFGASPRAVHFRRACIGSNQRIGMARWGLSGIGISNARGIAATYSKISASARKLNRALHRAQRKHRQAAKSASAAWRVGQRAISIWRWRVRGSASVTAWRTGDGEEKMAGVGRLSAAAKHRVASAWRHWRRMAGMASQNNAVAKHE